MFYDKESVEFLKNFHNERPGVTTRAFCHGDSGSKQSSYDLLCSIIPKTGKDITVVDLACGDGHLLELILQRRSQGIQLIGIDMASGEIQAAKDRDTLSDVTLSCEMAQKTSLPDNSVDYVLCHMSLMLINDIDDVVNEITRVLKPGGIFSAIVGVNTNNGGAFTIFVDLFNTLKKRKVIPGINLGSSAIRSPDGLNNTFNNKTGYCEPIDLLDYSLKLDADTTAVWNIMSTTYGMAFVSNDDKRELEESFQEATRLIASNNQKKIPCSLNIRQITCRKI